MSAAPDGEAFPTDLESVRKGDLESPTPSNGTQQKEPRMDNVYVLHETGELPLFWAELWQKKHGLNPIECKKEELDLAKFEKKLSRKIELHFNERFISYPKELKNNIMNGIVLSGFLEGYL